MPQDSGFDRTWVNDLDHSDKVSIRYFDPQLSRRLELVIPDIDKSTPDFLIEFNCQAVGCDGMFPRLRTIFEDGSVSGRACEGPAFGKLLIYRRGLILQSIKIYKTGYCVSRGGGYFILKQSLWDIVKSLPLMAD